MSPRPAPRETAEELQRVLEGRGTAEETARHADLVRTVELLTTHAVQPRPAFSADLRERLMTAARTELVPDPTATVRVLRPTVPARRRFGAVAASLVIVGTAAGAAAASTDALPGDPLYPVKRGTEQVGTSFSVGDARKGRSQLEHAGTRLDEARELIAKDADDRLVVGALRDFQAEAVAGSERLFEAYDAEQRDDDVAVVRSFAATQMGAVDDLAQADPDPVVAATLVDVADTLADLDAQASELCAQCSPLEELTTPTSVAAGAGGTSVDALLARPVKQARLDRDALQALRTEELRTLSREAERSAGDLAEMPAVRDSVPPVKVDQHGPVTSTLTPADAPTVPRLSDKPVRDLVDGVTGTLSGVTGTVGSVVPKTGTSADKLVDDLDDTVSGVTDDLLP